MGKKLIVFLCLAVFFLISFISPQMAKCEKPKNLVISSGPSGGNWYAMGAAFSDVLTKAGVPTSSVPGGGSKNIVAVSMGKADLGFAALSSLDAAYKGLKPFNKPYKDPVMLIRLDSNAIYFIVRKDSPIKDIADIRGAKVAGPAPGTSSQMIVGDMLKIYGIDENKDIKLRRGSMSEGAALFKDHNVDVYAITTGLTNASIVDIATSVPVRFLSISADAIQKMKEKNPGYRKLVIPPNHFHGQEKQLVTVGADAALIANKNMPEDHAYWVTKTIVENFNSLVQACSWLKTVKIEDMGLSEGIPIHPGAMKYFDEKK